MKQLKQMVMSFSKTSWQLINIVIGLIGCLVLTNLPLCIGVMVLAPASTIIIANTLYVVAICISLLAINKIELNDKGK
jgi:hypothetical protein